MTGKELLESSKTYKHTKKLEELIKYANTSDKKLEKMSYKEKQKVFKAKNSLCNLAWNSSKNGTYRNEIK